MTYDETEKEIRKTRRIIKEIKGEIQQCKDLRKELRRFKGKGFIGKLDKKTGKVSDVDLVKWKSEGIMMLNVKIGVDTRRLERFKEVLKMQLER